MNRLYLGKMNLSKIVKDKIFEGQTGKWIDISIWLNDEPDQYGNVISIEQSTKKDEKKIYIANAKPFVAKQPKDQEKAPNEMMENNDLPF